MIEAFHELVARSAALRPDNIALAYKDEQLRHAAGRYDALIATIVGPAAGKTLFSWPAKAFASAGSDWIRLMQTIVADRMGVIAELVDLKRRVFSAADDQAFLFAHHLMQQEFLVQVYLMALQSHWQQEGFSYTP